MIRKYPYRLIVVCAICAIAAASSGETVAGIVSFGEEPVPGALVRVRGTAYYTTTDSTGSFALQFPDREDSVTVTACKEGFYIGGARARPGDEPVHIVLDRYTEEDHEDYVWLLPESAGPDQPSCSRCHAASVVAQWKKNLHSKAATDPLVLSMYSGTDATGQEGVGPGFKLDYPGSAGSCANCHAPTAALKGGSWTTDLLEVTGVDTNGVHCDYCHKIAGARADIHGSRPGFMAIELRRPGPERQLFLGSFDDVPEDDAYLPLYESSLFCAPCHQYYNGQTPIYTSYTEWARSPYPREGVECQDCHMKPDGATTNLAPGRGGVERDPNTVPSHLQMGSNDSLFIARSVAMEVRTEVQRDTLLVKVSITNEGGGHHFPTGSPLRNALLVVAATDHLEEELPHIGGSVVPDWGGVGSSPDDYAGRPGKGLARVLQDQEGGYPAPQWRLTFVRSDTRIPAREIDRSRYAFAVPAGTRYTEVRTALIYRKAFKTWADQKGWDLPDYVVAENAVRIWIAPQPDGPMGDFDGSGVVDFADFFLLADAFGGTDPVYDLDNSGQVDFADFFLFADLFGREDRTEPIR